MKSRIKLFLILIATTAQLSAFNSYAQEDINTDPLFINEQITYTPISTDRIEDEKVRALQDKDGKKMYTIGMMYADGQGVEEDVMQALVWFKNSAEQGNSDAMIELAKIYSLDKDFTGMDKNQAEAQKWIKEAEKRNNSKAMYTLGLMYEEGFPFDKSYEKSFEYYKKAAHMGILNAYVKMYIAYQYGKGVDPDLKQAVNWLRKIQREAPDGNVKEYAKQMLADVYFELALLETDGALKFKLFNLSWSNGNRYALEAIGDMMQAGIGVKASFTSAIVAYNEAIKRYESVYAMERLGFIYLKGPAEIDRDYDKAYQLFKKASDLGGVTAAYMLGYMYHYGLGVNKDASQATMWFDRSKQFAQRKRMDSYTQSKAYDKSNQAIQNIISNVNKQEEERMKAFEEKTSGTDANGNKVVAPELPDVSKY